MAVHGGVVGVYGEGLEGKGALVEKVNQVVHIVRESYSHCD
jgi:hypothetical protein